MGPAAYNREKTSNIGHPRAFRQFRAKKVKCFGANDDVVKKPTEFIDRKWVTSDGTTRENLQLIDLSVLYLTHIVHDKVHDK